MRRLLAGKPMTDWSQLIEASKKERNLIIKISGFHESAWGARSVTLGSDSSRLTGRVPSSKRSHGGHLAAYFTDLRKAKRAYATPSIRDDGSLYQMEGRLRLCPYYFVDE